MLRILAPILMALAPAFALAQDVASNVDFAAPGVGDIMPKPDPEPDPVPLPEPVYPPYPVDDLAAYGESGSSVMLSWTAPSDEDDSDNTAEAYDIRYSTQPLEAFASAEEWFLAATPLDGEPSPLPGRSPQDWTVTNLLPSTAYYFGMKSADAGGSWSGASNIAAGATGSPEPTPEPSLSPTPTSFTGAGSDDGNDSTCSGSASLVSTGALLLALALISIVDRRS